MHIRVVDDVARGFLIEIGDDPAWLAAEVDWGFREIDRDRDRLGGDIRDLDLRHVAYDKPGDHEHCYGCMITICSDPSHPECVQEAYLTVHPDGFELWLCPRCFERYRARRNLRVV